MKKQRFSTEQIVRYGISGCFSGYFCRHEGRRWSQPDCPTSDSLNDIPPFSGPIRKNLDFFPS